MMRKTRSDRPATQVRGAEARARVADARHLKLGTWFYLGLALLFVLLVAKAEIQSYLYDGRTITAEFDDSYKLRPHDSSVKMAGLTVGTVTDLRRTDTGSTIVTMKVDDEALDTLGAAPIARIEPRTLLGGRYAIELHAGGGEGKFDGVIPIERTSTPVELDQIVEALPKSSREALQGLVGTTSATLGEADDELNGLLKTAPSVLDPGTDVLNAVRGDRPAKDLPGLVTDLNATADVATRRDGQLAGIARDLRVTSGVLADNRGALAETLAKLPQTLSATRGGLSGLDDSVTELTATAKALRPSAPELANLVSSLDPLLRDMRPLMSDLKPLLRDARPAVQALVPTARNLDEVLTNVRGPVLDRVTGPVSKFVLNPWKGTGPYKGGAGGYMADHKFYEELAYMATNIDRASMSQDQRGSTLAFQAGVGLSSLSGLPFDLESLVTLALDQAGITGALRSSIFKNLGLVP
ncbi:MULTISPECIES: MlaD family protein [unclassified Nocardioides]|uniref:MlaD family protein n=1 Tax=unclassified Nocardioides TaxID=2615069 RepID=UPI0009E96FA8|nr:MULTISPECIES: MlaD family protein [unclassified Nocardioides]